MGSAERVRTWWLQFIAGETGMPEELLAKVRFVEGLLPILAFMPGLRGELRGVKSIADLLPDDDEQTTLLLRLVNEWTATMLAPDAQTELGKLADLEQKETTDGE